MKKWNYYNDTDPKICEWARELIRAGHAPDGEVDCRSIADVQPDDLRGFIQCHFFCGILGWSLALKLAGWPTDRPVWTGSCPCQPFSAAGKGRAQKDERHLWPELLRLISVCRPPIVFGEQVASSEIVGSQLEIAFIDAVEGGDFAKANKLARRLAQSGSFHFSPRWLDGISADMEAESYALWPMVLGAHSKGSPHLRQRLFWMGYANGARPLSRRQTSAPTGHRDSALANGDVRALADAAGVRGPEHGREPGQRRITGPHDAAERNGTCGLADPLRERREGQSLGFLGASGEGSWSNFDILSCLDGKARRVESGTFPLAHGVSGRVGLLRGYGNAIVPQVAAQFIQACEEALANPPGEKD